MINSIRTTLLGSVPHKTWHHDESSYRQSKYIQHETYIYDIDVSIKSVSSRETFLAFRLHLGGRNIYWHSHDGKLYRELFTRNNSPIGPEGYPEDEVAHYTPSCIGYSFSSDLNDLCRKIHSIDYPTYLPFYSYTSIRPNSISDRHTETKPDNNSLIIEREFVNNLANDMLFIDGRLCRPAEPPVFEIHHDTGSHGGSGALYLTPIIDHMATKSALAHFSYNELSAARSTLEFLSEKLGIIAIDNSYTLESMWDEPANNHILSDLISIYFINQHNSPIKSTVSTWTQRSSENIAAMTLRNRHSGSPMTTPDTAFNMIRTLCSVPDAYPLMRTFFEHHDTANYFRALDFSNNLDVPVF